ncbi:MAG: hypothetical protein WCK82_05195 [Bacteroidota bacterium]|jgi:hypothetical protein
MQKQIQKIIGFVIILLCVNSVSAQKKNKTQNDFNKINENRVEIEINDNSDHTSIPIDKNGILVAYKTSQKVGSGLVNINFDLFDTLLNKTSTINSMVAKNYNYLGHTVDKQFCYILYANYNSVNKFMMQDPFLKKYTLFKIDPVNQDVIRYEGMFPKTFFYKDMNVLNGVVYLGGSIGPSPNDVNKVVCLSMFACFIPLLFYTPYYEPFVETIDTRKKLFSKRDIVFDKYKKTTSTIIDLDVNEEQNLCNLMIKSKTKKETKLTTVDVKDNRIGNNVNIKLGGNQEVFSGHINSFGNKKLMAGVYGNKTSLKRGGSPATTGIVVSMYEGNKPVFTSTIPYSKFKNFGIVTDKVKEVKSGKKTKKITESASSQNDICFHDFIIRDDEIICIGEVFYPTYHTETYTTVDANGRMSTRTVVVFDGYKYMGVVVLALDLKGNLKWENGVRVSNGPLSFYKDYKYKITEQEDAGIKILYSDGKLIKSATVYSDDAIDYAEDIRVNEESKSKKKKNNDDDGGFATVDYWYDDYFIAYGHFQAEKDKKSKDKKKNKPVYYLNKIEIE